MNTDLGLILGTASPIDIIIAIINWSLGLLALAAVILIIYGGFVWMFAGGEEEKINKAKTILRNALIGLVIVLSAWGIATYVINQLLAASDAQNSTYATPFAPYAPGTGSPFYIDHSNPRNEETDVPLCHVIAVTFSYPLNDPTVTASSFKVTVPSDGSVVDGSYAFSEDKTAAVFYPASDYQADTTYKVELTSAIEGINPDTGAVYNLSSSDSKRIFTFSTGTTTDDIPPTVNVAELAPFPADGDVDICLNPTLQVSFSESLDPASPSDNNFWLFKAADVVADTLDIGNIRLTSIGGESDDTIVTSPQDQLDSNTEYGISLYSGDPATDQFTGAIYDTCGNPLSGNFDVLMTGSPTDDYIDSAATTYPWTFTTGDQPYCVPNIDSVSQEDSYYSEDQAPIGTSGDEDTGVTTLTGDYLYPFYDVNFNDNISAAGINCFDTGHDTTLGCFVSHTGSSSISLRLPVASQTGVVSVENNNGADDSPQVAVVASPYLRSTSPATGPVGQYITIRGKHFGDYDPAVSGSERGQVWFGDVAGEFVCADGWDDTSIIVRVPVGLNVDDTPTIQVITAAGKYSNQLSFTVTDGTPGPGLCELVPKCSDTGADSVTALGENFGDDGAVYFQSSSGEVNIGTVTSWNVYNETYLSQTVVTDGTPVTALDTYSFSVGSTGISNSLDFKISCAEPPSLFESYSCDLSAGTYYLPNPTSSSDNACVNSVIDFAFTTTMDDTAVESGVAIYKCNNTEPFDDTTCTPITGEYISGFLDSAYGAGSTASEYSFTPSGGFSAGYYYKVTIPSSVTDSTGVGLDSDYAWNFKVRDDTSACKVDSLSVSPATERVTGYDAVDACLDNHNYKDTSYSLRARPATADCLMLDAVGDYTWDISEPAILTFGSNSTTGSDVVGSSLTHTTTNGYDTVCLQGAGETNDGLSTVSASIEGVSDSADIEVDFGYCTQDSDCYTADCRDTYCDATTSHCAPDVIGFTPATVGAGGCLTLNGCYFGSDQTQSGYCTCTSLKADGETCTIDEGDVACLLSGGISSCTLNEEYCELGSTCTTESAEANYDLGYFRGCDCIMTDGTSRTCRVEDGATQCVVAGSETCSATSSTFTAGGAGSISFGSTTASTPASTYCGDVWNTDQVVVQVPEDGSVTPGTYDVTLQSYYGLSDTIEGCAVGSDPTACLCRIEPARGQEGTIADLFGDHFDLFTTNRRVTFAGSISRVQTDGTETWTSANEINNSIVPEGAVSSSEGVQLEDDTSTSNALNFNVSCSSDFDCATGCCNAGQCAAAEQCNICTTDSDCSSSACTSTCVASTCAPVITKLSPDHGAVGQPVTIQGCHFGSYYDPASSTPGSTVTMDGIQAELACSETQEWSNRQIIVTAPDGIFTDATTDLASVQVQQVSTVNAELIAQTSNAVDFTMDNSCSEVDLPVLCNANPVYSPVANDVTLTGENFRAEADGYCACTTSLGDCKITAGDTSCTLTESNTYYVNPTDTSEVCANGSSGPATSNANTFYDATVGACVYTDTTDTTITCQITTGSASCVVTNSDTCYADRIDTSLKCSKDVTGFVSLDGSAQYYSDQAAIIDWTTYSSTKYDTTVPSDSETGDVNVISTTQNNTQCVSNGLEFPISCASCGECNSTADHALNCDLTYDAAFGSCTTSSTGFCRAQPDSCCNVSSCIYDDTATTAVDGGTCVGQPVVAFTDPVMAVQPGDTNICANVQLHVKFSEGMTTSAATDTSDNFDKYIFLRPSSADDTASDETVLSTITPTKTGSELTLDLTKLLDYDTDYELIIRSQDTIVSGTKHQSGVISATTGAAIGCDATMSALGVCHDGYIKYTFTTASAADYSTQCGPASVVLEADSSDFIDHDYTFNESGQTEDITATTYSGDSQAISRIDDGTEPGFSWSYDWTPTYTTLADLEADICPIAGIIGASTDVPNQTLTADTPDAEGEHTDTVKVSITGDGSVEQGWNNSFTDSLLYDFQYCDPDKLVTYSNSDYNLYWSYCQGDMAEFDEVFSRDSAKITEEYGHTEDFIYEIGFKDTAATTNDATTNNNLIVLRVYPNDIDGSPASPWDSINPDLWYMLNTNNPSATATPTTVNGYDAVTVGNTVYVAANNLDDHDDSIEVEGEEEEDLNYGTLSSYMFVVAYSADASSATTDVVTAILDGFKFNRNETLSTDCALEKAKLVIDTNRVTDLGTIAYLLSSYYYHDSDGNGVNDFPDLTSGSYITGLTTSVWPSWDAVLGDALGQTLFTDPVNTFADATTQCPYAPDDNKYYDASGSCWDPVNKKFFGPTDSHVYLYEYQSADQFALYSKLDYTGLGSWGQSYSYDPCTTYSDGTTAVSTKISGFSGGCSTFNYLVNNTLTTDNTLYAKLFAD
ncbi:MAG: Ig-like domain-containing protein [Patescibacteria group bacterium]